MTVPDHWSRSVGGTLTRDSPGHIGGLGHIGHGVLGVPSGPSDSPGHIGPGVLGVP